MRYLLCFLVPPLAILLCGKPGKALLNLVLWCCLIIPGIVHALLVVKEHKDDKRFARLEKAMRQ
ncbi:YqaE/Pmp3 family membrane protein [Paenibacillus sp. TAB 01]|uniref:YqaE/Pmp3 family membrane protein n=1 Tax=Paenibacillus sp. TAB 01 TaxID=3368988 RepID=UPI0037501219